MSRAMYDGVTPSQVPAGAQIYAGYADGRWPSYAALAARYPHALHVSVCVTASGTARCLDVEAGDAAPEQAPGWVARMRAAGQAHPWVYMDGENWPAVKAAFDAQHVAPPLYWVASYVQDPAKPPAIPAGAVGVQYFDHGGYDASLMADHIPGLDPDPEPAAPAAPTEEIDVLILYVAGTAAVYALSGGVLWHVADQGSLESYQKAGVRSAHVSQAELAGIQAAAGQKTTAP